ncbi:hypothetical protein CLV94_2074 [Flavobacterium endophyticum]|uniref:DUF4236 domain-containing protein n=1 Tax=Flavobacterium endophyticum TaxID=1540163 RepID=A0A495MFS2_9FLAO|nr:MULTISPECIES: DUF4236 domain-containing protein [unclassified Flavobacterium]RKS23169.1 hypothetical protein CLV94_2074 [Flavobacterium endophyticum]WDO11873.1 DUF4236 domain-containing protein [Flavobacterium sp. WW92]
MSFRFQKRIKLYGGLGINISKSGIYPSLRTRKGTISNKGYSIRTGISGISYQKNFKAKNNGCILFFALPGILLLLKQLLCH